MAEVENSLYARFVELCEAYELVGERLLVIPKEVISKFRDDDEEGIGRDQGKEKASSHDEKEDAKEPVKLFNGTSNLATSGSSALDYNQTLGRDKTARPTLAGDEDVAQGSSSASAANIIGAMEEEENEKEEDQREETLRSRSDSISSLQSTDSIQTAVHISDIGTSSQDVETEHVEDASPPHVAEVGTKEEKGDEEEVPKDEIDLLEDERNLEKEASVAPVHMAEEPKEEEAEQGETRPVEEIEPAEEPVQPISDDQVALEGSKKGESSGVKQDEEADKEEEAKLNGVKSEDGAKENEATSSDLPSETLAATEVIPVIESSSSEPAITSKTSVQPESKTVESASQEEQTPANFELPTGETSSEPSSESESGTELSPLSPALSPTTSSAEEKEDDKKNSLSKKRAKKAAQKARAKEREREAKAQAQAQAEAEAPEGSRETGKLEG